VPLIQLQHTTSYTDLELVRPLTTGLIQVIRQAQNLGPTVTSQTVTARVVSNTSLTRQDLITQVPNVTPRAVARGTAAKTEILLVLSLATPQKTVVASVGRTDVMVRIPVVSPLSRLTTQATFVDLAVTRFNASTSAQVTIRESGTWLYLATQGIRYDSPYPNPNTYILPVGNLDAQYFADLSLPQLVTNWLGEVYLTTTEPQAVADYIYYRGYSAIANRLASEPTSNIALWNVEPQRDHGRDSLRHPESRLRSN